jgi:hypothetical protein
VPNVIEVGQYEPAVEQLERVLQALCNSGTAEPRCLASFIALAEHVSIFEWWQTPTRPRGRPKTMGVITLVLIVANLQAAGTASFFTGIQGNPAIPEQVSSNAQVKLVSGSPSSPTQTCAQHSRMQAWQPPPLTKSSRRMNKPGSPGCVPRSRSWQSWPYWRSFSPPEYQPVSPARLPRLTSILSGEQQTRRSEDGSCSPPENSLANGLGNLRGSGGNKHLDIYLDLPTSLRRRNRAPMLGLVRQRPMPARGCKWLVSG